MWVSMNVSRCPKTGLSPSHPDTGEGEMKMSPMFGKRLSFYSDDQQCKWESSIIKQKKVFKGWLSTVIAIWVWKIMRIAGIGNTQFIFCRIHQHVDECGIFAKNMGTRWQLDFGRNAIRFVWGMENSNIWNMDGMMFYWGIKWWSTT